MIKKGLDLQKIVMKVRLLCLILTDRNMRIPGYISRLKFQMHGDVKNLPVCSGSHCHAAPLVRSGGNAATLHSSG